MRRHPRIAAVTAVGLGAIALSVTGCSSESPQENVSQACTEADALGTAIEDFRAALTEDATVEEVRAARDSVIDSYDTLMAEAQDVAQDRIDELESTIDRFQAAVDDVPDDAEVPDAVESLRGEATDVRTSLESLEADLTC